MDTTITHTIMPVIAKDLGNFNLFAWTFASYVICSTILAPIAGRLSDLYGRKKVFGSGIILFLLGSVLCGSSSTMVELVIFRAIQGIGAGAMIPFPAIIAGDIFSIEKRGKIQAFFSAMWGISAIIAPLIGAVFVEYLSWRWIFYVNIPICILSFLLLIPYKEEYTPKKAAVDYIGAILFTAGVSLLLLTTVVTSHYVYYILSGCIILLLFFLYEKRHPSPLFPVSLLRNRPIAWMIANSFLACAALFGTSGFIPLFLQEEGYPIFLSGAALLGMSLGWTAVSVPAGRWILRYGYGKLLILGNLLLVLTGGLLLFIQGGTSIWYVTFVMLIQGLSFGLIVTVSIIGAQQLVEADQKGISTSLQMFSRNTGTAIGITLMGFILTNSASFLEGFHHIFIYGFIVSLLACVTSFFIFQKEKVVSNH